jgi:hypothetical protein
MLVVPDVGLGSDTVGLLAAELDAHPEAIAAAPAVVAPDGKVVHCGGDIREHDPVVEFPLRDAGTAPAALRSRPSAPCAWAPATALLIRASALEQSPFDPEMAPYEAAEAFYRLTPPDGARVRACPGIQVGLRHRPAEPDLGEERLLWYCRVLPRLIGAARFHRRHDLVITDVFEILPELVRSDGVQDRAAAILVLELLDGIGPARFLMRWVRGELDPLLKAGALADRLSRAEDELDYAARHLEAVLGTRAWRLIRRLYRARDRVRR